MKTFILGGGVTGLAAGYASGLPVFEASRQPGGICSSYYMEAGNGERLYGARKNGRTYRFEIGGGHWIFGGDPVILRFMEHLTPMKKYSRKSAVFFPQRELYVPYPLQNHLFCLGPKLSQSAIQEIENPGVQRAETMKDWLRLNFGETLCEVFFYPFHQLYTAGLYTSIAPQDAYKSPVNLSLVKEGASQKPADVGYNVTFRYPITGLDTMTGELAARSCIEYGKQVVRLDVSSKEIFFHDGSRQSYDSLLSTLPLSKMIQLSGIPVEGDPPPYTSVLVLNIGAVKGPRCPDEHWVYVPGSRSGFHRVGFYSNVDPSFVPGTRKELVSIYVERSYRGGEKPSAEEISSYADSVAGELKEWGFIREPEVMDPTWIDVAYTWSWPGSKWKEDALKQLEQHDIYQVGRYGRWIFQGIADSIRDGLFSGSALKKV